MKAKGHRKPLWARLTALLCLQLMLLTTAQPVLAATAATTGSAPGSRRDDSAAGARAPKAASKAIAASGSPKAFSAMPSDTDFHALVSGGPPLSVAQYTANRAACESRRARERGLATFALGAMTGGPPSAHDLLSPPVADALSKALRMPAATAPGVHSSLDWSALLGVPTDGALGPSGLLSAAAPSDDACADSEPSVPLPVRAAHPTVEDEGAPYGQLVEPYEESTLRFDGAMLIVPAGAVTREVRITIRPIEDREAGALEEGMVNATVGRHAYRLGPHGLWFEKPVTLVLPFDKKLVPPGFDEQDLGVFYFDQDSGRWRSVPVREVQAEQGLIIAETEHFTDFIAATLAVPDHPTTNSFDANTINGLQAGDPAAGLELIAPPEPSSDGAAHLSYKLNIPPGRRGMEPDLRLTYNSDAGNGWMGMGWDLPISRIRVDTRFGVPRYLEDKETELYMLDGDELTPKGSNQPPRERARNPEDRPLGVLERTFVRRREGSFEIITRHGMSPSSTSPETPYWWEIVDKSGTHFRYGGRCVQSTTVCGPDTTAMLTDPNNGNIAEWALAEVVDVFGNRVSYEYQRDHGVLPGSGGQQWVQLYPRAIRYTDHTPNTDGQLGLQFELETPLDDPDLPHTRTDIISSGRSGFLVRTRQRLAAIYVLNPGTPTSTPIFDGGPSQTQENHWLRRYHFEYQTGEFGKTLLGDVKVESLQFTDPGNQEGRFGLWKEDHSTSFDYYLRPAGVSPSFENPVNWGTVQAANGLTHSSASSDGTNGFLGVGLGDCHLGHAGVGGGLTQGTDDQDEAIADFNGDGLPDFLTDGQVFYGRRDAPSASDGPLPYSSCPDGTPGSCSVGLSTPFSKTDQNVSSANAGVHVFGELGGAGVDWAWSDSAQHGGFADLDGDGLVDWIRPNGQVFQNPNSPFSAALTTPTGLGTTLPPDRQNAIFAQYPRADTLIRWLAPYPGTIAISGAVQRKNVEGGTVRVEIWHSRSPQALWSKTFASGDATTCRPGTVPEACDGNLVADVVAGDSIYFKTDAPDSIENTAVLWNPHIVYQTTCRSASNGCFTVSPQDQQQRVEPWGAKVFDFSQAADFRLAGPPDRSWVAMPLGTVQVAIKNNPVKLAPTADEVTIQVRKFDRFDPTHASPIPIFTRTLAPDFVGTVDLEGALTTTFGVTASIDTNSNETNIHADAFEFRVVSDSPIDPTAISWDPVVQYQEYCRTSPTTNAQVCAPVTCPGGLGAPDDTPCQFGSASIPDPIPDLPLIKKLIDQHAPVNVSTFVVLGARDGLSATDDQPTVSWPAPETGSFHLEVSCELLSGGADDNKLVFLAQGNQKLFGKWIATSANPTCGQIFPLSGAPGGSVSAGDPMYFTFVRTGSISFGGIASVVFDNGHRYPIDASLFNTHHAADTLRVAFADLDNPGLAMPGGFHEWSFGQWNGNLDFDPTVITNPSIQLPSDPNDAIGGAQTGQGVGLQPAVQSPIGVPPNPKQNVPGFSGAAWTSSGVDLYMGAGEAKPSRAGANPDVVILAANIPALRRSHGENSGGSVSVVASGALNSSDSEADVDFLDLNGDRYPDEFDANTVHYGNGLGGAQFDGPGPGSFRKFEGNHSRFGLDIGSGAAGIDTILHPSGSVEALDNVLPSLGNAYGRTRTETDLIDINGDGLPDRVERPNGTGALQVQFNLGYQFGPVVSMPAQDWGTHLGAEGTNYPGSGEEGFLRVQNDVTKSLQFGIGGIGAGISHSATRTVVDFIDINGDGLPDRVLKDPAVPNVLHVMRNLGESFAPEEIWSFSDWAGALPTGGPLDVGSNDALSFSESVEDHEGAGIPPQSIPIFLVCLSVELSEQIIHTTQTARLSMEDVNGDGFADQLLKTDDGLVHVKLNHEGLQHYDLLKTVTNALGGHITLEYARQGNTPDMPENQWALSSITTDDGLGADLRHDLPRTTTVAYKGGFYSRVERESFGYAEVTTTRPDLSIVDQTFHQEEYCSKGLPDETKEEDAAQNLFHAVKISYTRRSSDTLDSCFQAPTGQTTFLLDGTQKDENLAPKIVEESRDYDDFGSLIFYSNAGDSGLDDDVSVNITYDPDLASNHIFRPQDVTVTDGNNILLRERVASYFPTGAVQTIHDIVSGGHDPATGAPYGLQLTPNWQLTYDEFGNVLTVTDPTGYTLTYTYDALVHTYAAVRTDSFGYTSLVTPDIDNGAPTLIVDTNGNREFFTYDKVAPRLLSVSAPREYANSADPNNPDPTITISYHLPKSTDTFPPVPHTVVTHFDADHPSDPIVVANFIDGLGRPILTKKEVDLDDGQGGTFDGFSLSGRIVYDARGRVSQQGQPSFEFGTDQPDFASFVPLTNPVQYAYDILSRPTQVIQPNGAVTTTTYGFDLFDSQVRLSTHVTDPNDFVRVTYQDALGRVVGIDQTNTIRGTDTKLTTRYKYDPLGELLEVTDAKGNVTKASYDTVGHLTDLDSPDAGLTSYRYDLAGLLRAKETANLRAKGQLIGYAYDSNSSRLHSIDFPSTPGMDVVYTYGSPTSTDGGHGRITHVHDPSGDEDRTYDELGHVKTSTFTPVSIFGPTVKYSYTTSYTYDSFDRMLSMTYPDGETVAYHYDHGGNLNTVTGTLGTRTTPYVQKMAYDQFEQRTFIKLGNGVVTTYVYDPQMRWLTDVVTTSGATQIQKLHYTIDNIGNILEVDNNIPVATPVPPPPAGSGPLNGPIYPGPSSIIYQYDELYQLKRSAGGYTGCACGCSNTREFAFNQAYDEIGNIIHKDQDDRIFINGAGSGTIQPRTTYSVDYQYTSSRPHAATQIGAQILAYDNDGNEVSSTGSFEVGRTLTWDDRDLLQKEVDSSFTNTFLYNADGERTHKRRGSIETVYVNQYYVIRSALLQTKHIYAGSTRIASSMNWLSSPTTFAYATQPTFYYYHPDHLQSTNYTTDANGSLLQHDEYFPSGETWIEEVANEVDPIVRTKIEGA